MVPVQAGFLLVAGLQMRFVHWPFIQYRCGSQRKMLDERRALGRLGGTAAAPWKRAADQRAIAM
jgi:hypothetical protein